MRARFRIFAQGTIALSLALSKSALAGEDAAAYGFAYTPPAPANGTPEILKIELNSDDLRAGGPIAIRVTTATDVTEVVTGNGKHQGELTRVAPGIFTSQSTLPHVGGLLHVRIKLHFKATTAAGRVSEADVPVKYK